jgi:hypothetical protein
MVIVLAAFPAAAEEPAAPDYSRQVAPLLTKYCAGCHNGADRDGDLSLESFADLQEGGGEGPVVLPGEPDSSRLIRVLTGKSEPKMPPEDEPAPSEAEIALLKAWIAGGAKGPEGAEPDRMHLITPDVESHTDTRPIAAVDLSPDGRSVAVARFESVTIAPLGEQRSGDGAAAMREIGEYPGKVTAVHFAQQGRTLATASGVAGLGGVAALWNVADGSLIREFKGHRDLLYDAELSPDGRTLATCSYDRNIILWDAASGEQRLTLTGHNGAVYDVAFSPDGEFLVSASADDTCKVWRVADGERMDTLGQPLEEQYTAAFSPDGRFIVSGGADNRIRVWRFVSRNKPRINPLLVARFAHEDAVLKLAYSADGSRLVSIAEDRTVKVWETRGYNELHLQQEPEVAAALAADAGKYVVGRLDGSLASYKLPAARIVKPTGEPEPEEPEMVEIEDDPMKVIVEQEPNDGAQLAHRVDAPAQISGVVQTPEDSDLFRFTAREGEEWVVEVVAARSKSPLDSFVEVLNAGGHPVERVVLQAVRDSYFTFRGKNADESGDFRLFNWEEMELNEYLYANGEVVKLWLYPRGPDSGFLVYPGAGRRWGYFDTTPLAHALGEPAYIVEPHPPGTKLIPNGLPEFHLHYENDDESTRRLGADSKLYFTAPADGEYIVRIRDVRGFGGENYSYKLLIRPRNADFRVALQDLDPKVAPGSAKEFRVTAERLDGFDGPIRVELSGLPPGFTASTPIVIEEGQQQAVGVVKAAPDAAAPDDREGAISIAAATATIRGEEVSHPANGLGKISLLGEPKLKVAIVPAEGGAQPVAPPSEGPLQFEIAPGETIMLRVQVERNGYDGEVSFGKEDAGRNLPHGLYVDNIGLNGLLLLSDQDERDFFITAADWVPEQSRLFHLSSDSADKPASLPVMIHVRKPKEAGN